ncbi:hypothetical protein BN938_0864 [Mucinivorans hirudinis]|uniref:Uncharacterized protein n=1 Tax=Mucinivorans hirudinis TaxID=1433126 RepID=A0A060R743_9BACT|nr:hypothetical protein BN938_0864 [Mucinivorans hirudinis]
MFVRTIEAGLALCDILLFTDIRFRARLLRCKKFAKLLVERGKLDVNFALAAKKILQLG